MSTSATAARPAAGLARIARPVAVALLLALAVGLLLLGLWQGAASSLFLCTAALALAATAVFVLLAGWPRRLPRWIERWVLQVVAVGLLVPVATFVLHRLKSPGTEMSGISKRTPWL